MLQHLSINNFVIAQALEIDFSQGLNVLTGETGAGKSISLDALNLALGERAENQQVKHDCDKAEIHAIFDIKDNAGAQQWLGEHDLSDDNNQECILRRMISRDGRSRAYINGRPCAASQVKTLAKFLINIHGQHNQQSLLQANHQQQILDRFSKSSGLSQGLRALHKQWSELNKQREALHEQQQRQQSQMELLNYQLSELEELELQADETQSLEQSLKDLQSIEDLKRHSNEALNLCDNDESPSIKQLCHQVVSLISPYQHHSTLSNAFSLFEQAQLMLDEACIDLRDFHENFEADEQQLHAIESRLDKIYHLSRKHQVSPYELYQRTQDIRSELEHIHDCGDKLEQIEEQLQSLKAEYLSSASRLSKLRKKGAKKLAESVTQMLHQLHMPHAEFSISVQSNENQAPSANGFDLIQFLVSTHNGAKPDILKKIASGGELSRISLAIEVASLGSASPPALIFDEVDAGIGGATAEVVGDLLKTLSQEKQIICVTHQAQIASKAQQHLKVEKHSNADEPFSTNTQVNALNEQQRVEEISRMIGGIDITKATRQHAKDMLKRA